MLFYLGTHMPGWLSQVDVPLFVSRRRLAKFKVLPRARGAWALDSGGFSELNLYGGWSISKERYVDEVRRYQAEVGGMTWAAPMDWMCEPFVLEKTGFSVLDHQHLTVCSVLDLRRIAPDVAWIPVLQGWTREDYAFCVELYAQGGVDLAAEPVVGLGSVCRRQATGEAAEIVGDLHARGIRVHGFGVKTKGLERFGHLLHSADSLAWSYGAMKRPGVSLAECEGKNHLRCNNCLPYALDWRGRVLRRLDEGGRGRGI